ncbi:response regulator [Rhodobacteraceae bacterium HTCC2150]|nr:response regulator [Rhodobacteraceae bacterium HTCC2150]
MNTHAKHEIYETSAPATLSVLVVDDSKGQRRILSASLKRAGYDVTEAASGEEAVLACQEKQFNLVLSDWIMPGMNGLDFCKAFREMERDTYGYFILLTSKAEKNAVTLGLDVGADDFLTKPVNGAELLARMKAGERILSMEHEKDMQNQMLSKSRDEIQILYDAIDRDLLEAKKFQEALLSEKYQKFGDSSVSLYLKSSGRVGGDLVGYYSISDEKIGLYSIDVSGHGISSALMTARLAGFLSDGSPDQNVGLIKGKDGIYRARSPEQAVAILNEIVLNDMDTELYFTILLVEADLCTGHMRMSQAGHPHPVVQRANGTVEFPGNGGLPVGLIPGAEFDSFEVQLEAGDRLLLTSDGVTECADPAGNLLDDDGLAQILVSHRGVQELEFFDVMIDAMTEYSKSSTFDDDVSAVMLGFKRSDANLVTQTSS